MAIPFLTNTSFSAAITVATTGTFGGNITISNASPALNLTDTDNSSNIAFSSVGGALIVNSPSDQVYQIGGTEKFRIGSSTATFQGDVEIRTGKKLILQRPNNGVATEISTDSTGAMVLNSINSEGFFFNNNGTNIFKLDPVNATFTGLSLIHI